MQVTEKALDACFLFSRMDFPGSLPPTLLRTGPLGVSDTPDLSFMCSWRDALTLPGPLAQSCQVRMAGSARQQPLRCPPPPFPALTPAVGTQGGFALVHICQDKSAMQNLALGLRRTPCSPQRVS